VLLMDESTSAVDESAALQIEETIRRSGLPVLVVSHSRTQLERFCTGTIDLYSATTTPTEEGSATTA